MHELFSIWEAVRDLLGHFKWNRLVWSPIWENNGQKGHWIDFFFSNWHFSLNKHSYGAHSILLFCCLPLTPPAFCTFSQRGHLSPRICSAILCTVCSHCSAFALTLIDLWYWLFLGWWKSDALIIFGSRNLCCGGLLVVSSIFWRAHCILLTLIKNHL